MAHRWRAAQLLIMTALAAALPSISAAQATVGAVSSCEARFPFLQWEPVGEAGVVEAASAAVDPAVAGRALSAAGAISDVVTGEIPTRAPVYLCLFGPTVSIDPSGLLPPGARVHAVADGPGRLVALDTGQLRSLESTIAYGVAYVALWRQGERIGGYPEPLASAVAQWYMARIAGRLDLHHAQMRTGSFFADPEGDDPARDWASARQQPVLVWNPEFVESPVGDFVEYAVASRGIEMIRSPDPAAWAQAELAWRRALRDELLRGAGGEGWKVGLAIVAGLLAAAGLLAFAAHRARRRRPPGPVAEPIPGYFESSS